MRLHYFNGGNLQITTISQSFNDDNLLFLIFYAIISQAHIIANQSKKGGKMLAINYEKYSNMNERQLLNSLLNAEKKETKIKTDLQENSNLISFLKAKLKEKIDRPKHNFIPYEQSQSYKLAREYESTLSETKKAELMAELEADINKDYGDEL